MQVFRSGSSAGFDAYMADPARAAMADRRDEAVDRTEVHRVTVVG